MTNKPGVKIISWNIQSEAVCASAARMSTTTGNADEIYEKSLSNKKNRDLIRKVLSSGHKSVIEHAVFSMAFRDVSAVVEQFLIECRLASFTVKSRRYVDFTNLGYLVPQDLTDSNLYVYHEYMGMLFDCYKNLLGTGVPKEDARFVLPYSFCSNFYCTMNARELCKVICAMKNKQEIPELCDLGNQLEKQVAELFPAMLSELDASRRSEYDCADRAEISRTIVFTETENAGKVDLFQAPCDAMTILKKAYSISHPGGGDTVDIERIVASGRPRELEHLNYTFIISDITLSGVTHLVRHRMQSIVLPKISDVDHSRFILPDSVKQNPAALALYQDSLKKANEILLQLQGSDLLQKYGYYFAVSGNLMNVMVTMNARELMLFIRLRSCNRAQWEIRAIAIRILNLLRKDFSDLFDFYGPSCVLTGYCPEGKMTCGHKAEVIRALGTSKQLYRSGNLNRKE